MLEAVDCAIMLLDSAKGLEPQTLKLFDVCRSRHVPVVTFVNKWDRPGREPLELLDEIEQRIGLRPTPVNWPVGIAGRLPRADRAGHRRVHRLHADAGRRRNGARGSVQGPGRGPGARGRRVRGGRRGGARAARRDRRRRSTCRRSWPASRRRCCSARRCRTSACGGCSTPCAIWRPRPRPRADVDGDERPVDAPFSGLVFKVQANMDPAHRDRVAFVRVCSGRFERGMVLTHAATGRPFATKYAQAMFGQERETVETAFPGDVIGLVNATALRPGDTLYADVPVAFPPIPSFAPEHFAVVRCKDAGQVQAVPAGHRPARHRGRGAGARPRTCAATRRRCSPRSGRCSSTWCCTGSSTSSARSRSSTHLDYSMARLTDEAGVDGAGGRARRRGADPAARRGAARAVRRQVAAQRDQAGQPVAAARPAAGGHRPSRPPGPERRGPRYFIRATSIWSKSPRPLRDAAAARPLPHQRVLARRWSARRRTARTVDVPCRHQPVGAADRFAGLRPVGPLVGVRDGSVRAPVPKIDGQIVGEE